MGNKKSLYFIVFISVTGVLMYYGLRALPGLTAKCNGGITVPKSIVSTDNSRNGDTSVSHLNYNSPQSDNGSIYVPHYNLPSYNSSTIVRSSVIIVTIFPLITDPSYKKSNFGSVTEDRLEERMLDFLESLQYMLLHPLISEVHVFYDQVLMPGYIVSRMGPNVKLKFDKFESAYNPRFVFEFVHQKFKDRLVMVTNGDIYPWEGLDKLDYDLMKSKRLFYIMSRHGRREARCDMFPQVGYCDPGGNYFGSHDSYIFVPIDPLPSNGSEMLGLHNWDSMGLENVILYIYKTFLNYQMLNPCKVIFIYHNHCSKLRHNDRKRALPLTKELKKAMSPPTDQLQ